MPDHHGRENEHYNGSFARMPEHLIYDAKLRPHLVVLAVLIHRSDYATGLTRPDCSVRCLAAALDLSIGTVRYHLEALVAAGVIVLHLRARGVRPAVYRLPWVPAGYPQRAAPSRASADLARDPIARYDPDESASARSGRALARDGIAHNSENRSDLHPRDGSRAAPRALIEESIEEGRRARPPRPRLSYAEWKANRGG